MSSNEQIIDLHIHTTASDGQYSPKEIVMKAKERGCKLIAITDHDTVSGIAEGRKYAKQEKIEFISGIEISAQEKEEIHILGYGIDENDSELAEQCKVFVAERKNRADKICNFLRCKNIFVDMDEIQEIANGEIIARPHFAKYLQIHEYVSEQKEAFDKYLDTEEFRLEVTRKKPSSKQAIKLIHNAGGLAFLAHPGLIKKSNKELEDLISELKKLGLDGIECFYSKHSKEQSEYFMRLVQKYDLLYSVGSDFHGEKVKEEIVLGIEIPYQGYCERMVKMCTKNNKIYTDMDK